MKGLSCKRFRATWGKVRLCLVLSREWGNGLMGTIIGDYIGTTLGIFPTKNQTVFRDRPRLGEVGALSCVVAPRR